MTKVKIKDRKRKFVNRIWRLQGEPYLRYAFDNTKNPLGRKRWCIRFGNKEYGYPKYLAKQNGINLEGKRIIYKKEYNWINPPTINDFEIISDSSKLKQPLLYADLTACVM
jgi:hypothetical protein